MSVGTNGDEVEATRRGPDEARDELPGAHPDAAPDLLKLISDLPLQVEYIARNTVSSIEVVK